MPNTSVFQDISYHTVLHVNAFLYLLNQILENCIFYGDNFVTLSVSNLAKFAVEKLIALIKNT